MADAGRAGTEVNAGERRPSDDVAPERPFLIGLSGPIGCGKSTVARMLADLGGTVIDADVLAREATAPGKPALAAIRSRFGEGMFAADGSLDRAALASVVFADADALRDLERIVHPEVRRQVDTRLERAARDRVPFVVIEAIKLVEGGLADRCDEVWLADCAPETQRERLSGRGMAEADIDQRVAAQGERLAERLAGLLRGRVRVRRLSTETALDDTRETVENALADALTPLVLGDAPLR
jgi:dephospho-CoA kinase